MRNTLIVLFGLLMFSSVTVGQQNLLTGKEIYRINCKAIVHVKTADEIGVGFIVSSDGIIMTANHVVTTRDSHFRRYATEINIFVDGDQAPYKAVPMIAQVSDEQASYDSAMVKIQTKGLPYVTLGTWDEVDVGDALTLVPNWPGIGCLMLQATVSSKIKAITLLGPKVVNTIVFQSPVRNGFSGTPIFSSTGHVVAIQTTKIFGINEALDEMRTKWEVASTGQGTGIITHQIVSGVDLGGNFIELINNLDQNLISGLGSGVAIDHAKQLQENAAQPQKK